MTAGAGGTNPVAYAWLAGASLLLVCVPASPNGVPEFDVKEVKYYAHNFDPLQHEPDFPMDFNPPRPDEAPNGRTDTAAAGDPGVTYNFTATVALPRDSELSHFLAGKFLIWIKANPENVPAPETKVSFELKTLDGVRVGNATLKQNVISNQPVRFEASWIPHVSFVSGGTFLRWTVNITGPPESTPSYNPVAAPFGVSRDHPFTVSFWKKKEPPPEPMIRVEVVNPQVDIPPGKNATFGLKVYNDGDTADGVNLSLEGLGSDHVAVFQTAEGLATNRLDLDPKSSHALLLIIRGLEPGKNHTLSLKVHSDLGADQSYELHVAVSAPTLSPTPTKGTPGFGAAALLLLTLLVGTRRRRTE